MEGALEGAIASVGHGALYSPEPRDRGPMKVCSACGATYSDRIDFCFHDGSPLSAHSGSAAEAPVPRTLRADVSDNRTKRRSLFGSTGESPPPRTVTRPSVPAVILEAPDFVPAPLPPITAEPP